MSEKQLLHEINSSREATEEITKAHAGFWRPFSRA